MIILDTNVVSEGMRPRPAERVMSWLDRQPTKSLFTTTITEVELWIGVETLPDGARRRRIASEIRALFDQGFRDRVLSFDSNAARACAEIVGMGRRIGRPIEVEDAMIAGIAVSRGTAIATRNMRDFEGLGIDLVDPWSNH